MIPKTLFAKRWRKTNQGRDRGNIVETIADGMGDF